MEIAAQEEHLRAAGCMLAQGNRFAPALPAAEVVEHIAGWDGSRRYDGSC